MNQRHSKVGGNDEQMLPTHDTTLVLKVAPPPGDRMWRRTRGGASDNIISSFDATNTWESPDGRYWKLTPYYDGDIQAGALGAPGCTRTMLYILTFIAVIALVAIVLCGVVVYAYGYPHTVSLLVHRMEAMETLNTNLLIKTANDTQNTVGVYVTAFCMSLSTAMNLTINCNFTGLMTGYPITFANLTKIVHENQMHSALGSTFSFSAPPFTEQLQHLKYDTSPASESPGTLDSALYFSKYEKHT